MITIKSITDLNSASLADLLEFYNHHADKPVKRFSDRKAAARRVKKLVEDNTGPLPESYEEKTKAATESPKVEKKAAEKPARSGRGRTAGHAGKSLFALSEVNPRKGGTFGYESMKVIIENPGITYEDYIKQGGRSKDLRWDIEHGNVEVK